MPTIYTYRPKPEYKKSFRCRRGFHDRNWSVTEDWKLQGKCKRCGDTVEQWDYELANFEFVMNRLKLQAVLEESRRLDVNKNGT